MPNAARQVKMIMQAIETLANDGDDKEATLASLTEIQEYVQEKIDEQAEEGTDD
jgi:hypothetical protein